MEQSAQNHPEVYDFRQYDRIWQRVAPTLEPYPSPGRGSSAQKEPAEPVSRTEPAQAPETTLTPAQVLQESTLPGAERNPCCMGSAAAEMLEVLTGFVEGELADQRYYQTLARQAPSWARQQLRDIAADEGSHARRLMAVYFLITGECYRPTIHCDRIYLPGWCAALRERYHEEACGGLNYVRAAEGTTDPCLARLLDELSADEYRHADTMLRMLERSLRR
ncbi:ferritin-like domain-containing protein [Oscillibacter valericigenes]|uniref:ferritin-like domain-containing protein n=1 Tax=Oscillibacter valericigenes TaxID=351091 RepID=UPI001F3E5C2E|nr:ferritin-like domain-containing protein [Oscillibacter valericigenes]MCF2663926.1 ferritin-like domain-containing protein [Oscillibacter valericigenes]